MSPHRVAIAPTANTTTSRGRCFLLAAAAAALIAPARPAHALEPGGTGSLRRDCIVEYGGFALNYPPPPAPKRREFRCFDGDPSCDTDGTRNGSCAFSVQLCFAGDNVPGCSAGTVSAVRVRNPRPTSAAFDPELDALQTAGRAVLPTSTANTCGAPVTIHVPATGKHGAKRLRVHATGTGGSDGDNFRMTCVKSGWTKYQHDLANSGSNSDETTISPANAATLTLKWTFQATSKPSQPHYVTAEPTVADDRVYIGAWNGVMYALHAADGTVAWQFDTADPHPEQRGNLQGIQSSAAVLADGRVYFGAADANIYCLSDKGALIWKTSLGNPDQTGPGSEGAHAWSSPAIIDGKVFVGRASHEDAPCIRGRFFALDQDTGAILWQQNIVPDKVCDNAPATICASDAECPGGSCVANKVCTKQATQFCTSDADCDTNIAGNFCSDSKGGAITSSAAIDAGRNHVYITTGDCLQQGAIGDAESIMAFDMDSGARLWANRANPIGETSDFDYISSPSVFTATDGMTTRDLVGAGNKNGAFYAVDRDTGSLVWSRSVVPGFVIGGFIGSHAVAGGQIFSGTFTGPPYVHALNAFDGTLGPLSNSSSDARTFAAATYANGVVFNGSQLASLFSSGLNRFRAYDAATGTELFSTPMPGGVASGAAIVDGRVFVGYGDVLDGNGLPIGGVQAFGLP